MRPLFYFIVVGLAPSAIFGFLNYLFNRGQNTPIAGATGEFFERVEVRWVNGLLYPIAVFFVVLFAWPVLTAVAQTVRGSRLDAVQLPKLRRRSLYVGNCAAWIGMALWIASGIIFPGWLKLHFGAEDDFYSSEKYASFILSQTATGWISSTLTFFLITGFFVRAFYPVLVRPEQSNSDEVADLMRLDAAVFGGSC